MFLKVSPILPNIKFTSDNLHLPSAGMSTIPESHLGSLKNKPGYITGPNRKDHEYFLRQTFELLLKENVFEGIQRNEKVCKFKPPEELKKIINLEVSQHSVKSQQELIDLLRQICSLCVKTGHPYFINQLFSGLDPYGLAGELVAASLNSSVYTYEVSPIFTMMELEVFQKMREIAGFPQGKGDGILAPGGSISNGYGISVARFHKRPNVKAKGLSGGKTMVMFTSEDAHYSCKKLAAFEGLGTDNVVGVKVDARGKMMPKELEKEVKKALSEGKEPFMVIATAATTVIGAYDPIDSIADICQKYKLWLHVDAAWGGGVLMSSKHRSLMRGIEKADSLTWNPHKLLCAPQQCSVFLCKDENILLECNSASASYLFQKDKFYDSQRYDTGDKYIQCGRRADILKFWLMWKAKGTQGFEKHIDHIFHLKEQLIQEIKNRGDRFRLLMPDYECTNVSFWYVPPGLRNLETDSKEFQERINKVAPIIKERMMLSGSMMVSYQTLRHFPNFFRTVFQSSTLTSEDVKYFLDQFETLGKDLKV